MKIPSGRALAAATVALGCAGVLALLATPVRADESSLDRLPGGAADAPKGERLPVERGLEIVELPGRVLPPTLHALGCATPQSSGTIQATHPFYDVFIDAGGGSFTARTGASHSVTALAGTPQNVIYGGAGGGPGTSDVSWRFHDQLLTYTDPTVGVAIDVAACVFDPPDTAMEPNSIGIEQEWTVSPAPGITCTLRQELVAFGTTEADSGVRMTLGTTNWASSVSTVNVGVRWQIDYQNSSDDGPWFATVTCDPPEVVREWNTEHELTAAEIRDFYRIQNNTGFPIFANVSSTTSIVGINATSTPDRLVYGRWGAMVNSAWDYAAVEGAAGPDSDSAVLWYHGYLPVDGDVLAPGESSRHSVVIFTSADTVDCGTFIPGCATSVVNPPANQVICAGDVATLDASGITLTDCTGTVDYTWTDGVSTWPGPIVMVSPAVTTAYSVAVTCSTDPACRVDMNVLVTVDRPPDLVPPLLADPDPCNNGIKLTWPPARFYGATGTGWYSVFRSEVSCADALLQPPLAILLSEPGWFDGTTRAGVTYYYVVEAEDGTPGSACTPTGAGGGAVSRMCVTSIDDIQDETTPAGAGAVLRAFHVGDSVTMYWNGLRALLPGEHPHLRKTWLDPRNGWVHVNPEGDLTPSFTETDTSAWLQFFDLRVANTCERESLPD